MIATTDIVAVAEASKHHRAGSGLVDTDEFNFNFLTDTVASIINNDHSPVAKIGDTLMRITTGRDNLDTGVFAGKIFAAESEGEFIKIKDINMLGLSNFLQIVIISENETMIRFSELHEAIIDRGVVELVADDGGVEVDDSFQLTNGFETGAGAGALLVILAVGEELKFVRNAPRNEDFIADKTSLGDGQKAWIHKGRGVNIELAAPGMSDSSTTIFED